MMPFMPWNGNLRENQHTGRQIWQMLKTRMVTADPAGYQQVIQWKIFIVKIYKYPLKRSRNRLQ